MKYNKYFTISRATTAGYRIGGGPVTNIIRERYRSVINALILAFITHLIKLTSIIGDKRCNTEVHFSNGAKYKRLAYTKGYITVHSRRRDCNNVMFRFLGV